MTDSSQATPLSQSLGERWQDSLETIVSTQLEQYGSLDALSERQRACIESGDADRLMGLLGERAELIEAITESVKRFEPYAQRWEQIETALPEAAWHDLRRRLDAIASIADSVAQRDAEDTRLIEKNKNEIADKLAGVNKSRNAAKAYAGPRKSGARYQDREA